MIFNCSIKKILNDCIIFHFAFIINNHFHSSIFSEIQTSILVFLSICHVLLPVWDSGNSSICMPHCHIRSILFNDIHCMVVLPQITFNAFKRKGRIQVAHESWRITHPLFHCSISNNHTKALIVCNTLCASQHSIQHIKQAIPLLTISQFRTTDKRWLAHKPSKRVNGKEWEKGNEDIQNGYNGWHVYATHILCWRKIHRNRAI